MPLSCSCPTVDDAEWWWYSPEDYSTFKASRRKRCKSCGTLINQGAVCTEFRRSRQSTYMEEKIFGFSDDIELASWFHCEKCADLYFSLSELGFCVSPEDDMRELVKEYAEMKE